MKKISKKRHLEMIIQNIPPFQNPKVELEQYSTPSTIAADLLWNAYSFGDISDKNIVDLGCGTGIFSIASSLLGANEVFAVDIDGQSIEIAKNTAEKMGICNINFFISDVSNFSLDKKTDTLFQNPPFGSQKTSKKGSDLKFIDLALNISRVIYSFHMASTRDYIYNYFNKKDAKVTDEFNYEFIIPKLYDFHKKEKKHVNVVAFRVENF